MKFKRTIALSLLSLSTAPCYASVLSDLNQRFHQVDHLYHQNFNAAVAQGFGAAASVLVPVVGWTVGAVKDPAGNAHLYTDAKDRCAAAKQSLDLAMDFLRTNELVYKANEMELTGSVWYSKSFEKNVRDLVTTNHDVTDVVRALHDLNQAGMEDLVSKNDVQLKTETYTFVLTNETNSANYYEAPNYLALVKAYVAGKLAN